MTTRTRYFVIASLAVLAVGLGSGLLAYYFDFPTRALSRQGRDELQYVPADASMIAFADVQAIMASGLRQKVRTVFPTKEDGQQEFARQTGINIDSDIDRVVVAASGVRAPEGTTPGTAVVLARGRFDVVKIEALMRDHGAQVEDYKGVRVLASDGSQGKPALSLAFLEPGLIALGGTNLVHSAVDLKAGGASIMTNDEIMNLVKDLDAGNAWAVGRFDVLASQARFPEVVRQNLPAISLFSASARIDSGIHGVVRAETRDDEAANSLRDVIKGATALGKLQGSGQPALQTLLQSVQLGGTGKTVSLSFDLTPDVLDELGAMMAKPAPAKPDAAPAP